VTVNSILGNGTLGLDITGSNNISDLATNTVNITPTTDEFYLLDHNDAPTLTATANNALFTESSGAVDLFSSVVIDTVEPDQTVEALQFTLSNATDGAHEIMVIDGENITLTDANTGTTAANNYGYNISLSGTTVSVTLTIPGTSVADAQTLVDGLAYRNTNTELTTASRVVTLTSIKDSGGTVNGGVDTSVLSVASTVMITEAIEVPAISFPVADQTVRGNDPFRLEIPAAGAAQFEEEAEEDVVDKEPEISELANSLALNDQFLSSPGEQLNINAGIDINQEVDLDDSNYANAEALKPKYIDLQHLEIRQFETMSPEILELNKFVPDDSFFESLKELGKDLDESIDEKMEQTEMSASVTVLAVTTGIMSWVLRAGSLLGGFLSVIPLWRQFDPLPVLVEDEDKKSNTDNDKEELDSDAVENIFNQNQNKND
jgi:hypothetical protein